MEKEFENTTNDDLARMIAKGFEGVDKRFDKLERLEFEMKELKDALILK